MKTQDRTIGYPGIKRGNKAQTLIALAFASILILFLPLIIKLLFFKRISGFTIPPEFNLGTIAITAGSWLLHQCRYAIQKDRYRQVRLILLLAVAAGTGFICLQYMGLKELYAGSVTTTDIKVIVAIVLIHGIHLFIALLFVLSLFVQMCSVRSGAECYIFFLDPRKHFLFMSYRNYWNFLCLLWIAMHMIMLVKVM